MGEEAWQDISMSFPTWDMAMVAVVGGSLVGEVAVEKIF
jgi:hypothetical protein